MQHKTVPLRQERHPQQRKMWLSHRNEAKTEKQKMKVEMATAQRCLKKSEAGNSSTSEILKCLIRGEVMKCGQKWVASRKKIVTEIPVVLE